MYSYVLVRSSLWTLCGEARTPVSSRSYVAYELFFFRASSFVLGFSGFLPLLALLPPSLPLVKLLVRLWKVVGFPRLTAPVSYVYTDAHTFVHEFLL